MALDGGNVKKNFAPVEPIRDAKKTAHDPRKNPSSSAAFLRELHQENANQFSTERREMLQQGYVLGSMMNGKLVIKGDLTGRGLPVVFPASGLTRSMYNQPRSNYPVFSQVCETWKSKWGKVRPGMASRIIGDGYRAEIQANYIDRIVATKFADIFTVKYEADEIMEGLMYGGYNTMFYADDNLNRITKLAPIVQNEDKVLLDGYGGCLKCPFEGKPEDFQGEVPDMPQCPSCGSFSTTKMIDPHVEQVSRVTGVQEISNGDVTGKILPFTTHKWDYSTLASLSDYHLTQELIPERLVKSLYGESINFETGGDDESLGLWIMTSLANRGGNTEDLGESRFYRTAEWSEDKVPFLQDWWKPAKYAGFMLEEDETTVSGDVIPAGVDWAELFPKGICVQGFNSMNFITGIYGEMARIASGIFLTQPYSGVGKGLSDAADVQKDLNEIHSMAMEGIKRTGASGLVYDKDVTTLADIKRMLRFGQAVPVKLSKSTANITSVNQAIQQLNLNPVNPVLPQYAVQLMNLFNLVCMTGEFTQGTLQDVDINTLGGQELATEKANEQKASVLTYKVYHRQTAAEHITEIIKEIATLPRYYGAASTGKSSKARGRYISAQDLPEEQVKFSMIPGSDQTLTRYQQKERALLALEKAGGLQALDIISQQNPFLASWYCELLDINIPSLDREQIQITCLERLETIKELATMLADPNAIMGVLSGTLPPPNGVAVDTLKVREKNHLLKSDFIQEILDDEEFQELPPAAQQAIQLWIEAHHQLQAASEFRDETIRQQVAVALQTQAAYLAATGAAPLMEDAQQKQTAQSDEQMAKDALLHVGKTAVDEAVKDADLDRSKELESHKAQIAPPAGQGQSANASPV